MDDKNLLEAIGQMMDSKLEPIHADIQDLKTGQAQTNERLDNLGEHLAKVADTQENLVLPKIELLAEGHGEIIDNLKGLKGLVQTSSPSLERTTLYQWKHSLKSVRR